MDWHRTIVIALIVATTGLALAYVSTFPSPDDQVGVTAEPSKATDADESVEQVKAARRGGQVCGNSAKVG